MSCAFIGTGVGGPGVAVGVATGVAIVVAVGVAAGVAVAPGGPVTFGDGVPVADEPPPTTRVPPPPEQATKAALRARQSTLERMNTGGSFRLARIYGSLYPLVTSAAVMVVAPEQGPVVLHVLVTAPK
jgi:hypothetical protein